MVRGRHGEVITKVPDRSGVMVNKWGGERKRDRKKIGRERERMRERENERE